MLVIGAGFIGLEVAAAAIQRGCTVTVLEAGAKPLQRVAPPELGRFYEALHSERGVVFRFNTGVASFERLGEKIVSRCQNGDQIISDIVVAGIGVIPNTEIAAQSGLAIDRGILVDAFGATNDPAIFAVGDVAQQFELPTGSSPIVGKLAERTKPGDQCGQEFHAKRPASRVPASAMVLERPIWSQSPNVWTCGGRRRNRHALPGQWQLAAVSAQARFAGFCSGGRCRAGFAASPRVDRGGCAPVRGDIGRPSYQSGGIGAADEASQFVRIEKRHPFGVRQC